MASPLTPLVDTALENLIENYHDLNAPFLDESFAEPSALEFMRAVAKNRPFVIRKGAASWPAVQQWNVDYLKTVLKNTHVNVANTPFGNADAIAMNIKDGLQYFVKPFEQEENFDDFLNYVREQELSGILSSNVKYAQTQNDNLRGEYSELFKDVEEDIVWARLALGPSGGAEAINLWIGNSRSVTALHKDNYENIYVQVVGEKHFVLVPPVEMPCVLEKALPSATYAPVKRELEVEQSDAIPPGNLLPENQTLKMVPDEDTEPVPCATWDPDQLEEHRTGITSLSRPMRVTLRPGDMLYLPSLWYHKVSQSCGPEGICVAVNYWYDMDFGGSHYASNAFIRDIALAAAADREVATS